MRILANSISISCLVKLVSPVREVSQVVNPGMYTFQVVTIATLENALAGSVSRLEAGHIMAERYFVLNLFHDTGLRDTGKFLVRQTGGHRAGRCRGNFPHVLRFARKAGAKNSLHAIC